MLFVKGLILGPPEKGECFFLTNILSLEASLFKPICCNPIIYMTLACASRLITLSLFFIA